ncbi:TIGR03087 family PEP-CTERM/XrtA system glycosyltransferase [Magnetospira thiophila]
MTDQVTDLLFLSQRIPYPPDKGDKIRSFNILRHLVECGRYRVHLGCFIDAEEDWAHVPVLRELCADSHFVRLGSKRDKIAELLQGLLRGEALTLPYYRDADMAGWVNRVMDEVKPANVFVYSSAMAQYVLDAPARGARLVMDFVDVDSDKWRQYADTVSWPMSWVYRRESRTLLSFDARVAEAASASVFVSTPEAELFQQLVPQAAGKTLGIANGIDAAYFSPEHAYPDPYDGIGPALCFTGAMDYWPNVDAVGWFAQEIFPKIRKRHSEALFAIVGGSPTPEVRKLGERPGVMVTGRVPDVRPYIAHAAVAVAPMRIARGIQNKVLEAMAMGRPTVTTAQGLEGIDAGPGQHLLLANSTQAIAEAVLGAIHSTEAQAMGAAARARVIERYSWSAKLAQFDQLFQ